MTVYRELASRKVLGATCALVTAAGALAACGSSGGGSNSPGTSGTSLISSARCAANKAAGQIVYESPFGYDASAGIIDVFAADKLGYFKDLCLNVKIITNAPNATALVSSGRATTTNVGSAADFLVDISNGNNIKAVATYGATSDYCIITAPSITSLKGLEGKKLGYHFVPEAPDLEMLTAAGADLTKIHMINTSNYDPNQVVQGKIDGVGCYQSNEPLTLKAEGAKFNEFTPDQFGVSGTYNVEFFNGDFLKNHADTVKDWMRADLHAFDYCEANQAACIKIEEAAAKAAGAEYSVPHETQVWKLESALSKGHTLPGKGIGVESTAEWQPEAKEVTTFKLIKNPLPPLSQVEDTTMVDSLYNGTTLIWPGS
jgi:NitT/TauT family transport system substrate-binding protein